MQLQAKRAKVSLERTEVSLEIAMNELLEDK